VFNVTMEPAVAGTLQENMNRSIAYWPFQGPFCSSYHMRSFVECKEKNLAGQLAI